MSTTFDELNEMVRDLWPSYKASVYPLWQNVLCRHDVAEVRAALRQQRATDPDGTKPIWKSIYAELGEATRSCANLLGSVLAGVRTEHETFGTKGARHWTDEQCFLNYLDAQSRPVLFDAEGRPKHDRDGRRGRLAQQARQAATCAIVNDLRKHAEALPDWLERMCTTGALKSTSGDRGSNHETLPTETARG